MNSSFDDIRPYYDSELPEAMQRIVNNPLFGVVASYVFPELSVEEVREKMLAVRSIHDFQYEIMYYVNRRIIQNTITELSVKGIENIRKNCGHLYISNHRDIMLDASLMQNIMMDNELPTTQITFGANLMKDEIVIDIGKSNKMFRVERPGGNLREFYNALTHLSHYIRRTIVEQSESVWIAQRNGRTKNGIDRTDQGVLNMFRLSCPEDKIESIVGLNILPVVVSYEWEPCDVFKAKEIYATRRGPYAKDEDEDLRSIITGITQQKGRVHFEFCKPLTKEDIEPLCDLPNSEFNKRIAHLIDHRICNSYRLFANNYIAYDMLNATDEFRGMYTAEERARFESHIERCVALAESCDTEEIREILLGIYAYSVESKKEFSL